MNQLMGYTREATALYSRIPFGLEKKSIVAGLYAIALKIRHPVVIDPSIVNR